VPALPVTLQASHWPVQALSQHTPSTQFALPHCSAEAQAVPFESLGTQTPAEHQSPATQSLSPAQLPLQAAVPQTYAPQAWVCGTGQ
jgi:hypothetical protein